MFFIWQRLLINVATTEVIVFRTKKKQLEFDLHKFKALQYKTPDIKFCKISLGLYLDGYLDQSLHTNHLSKKLVKANATHTNHFSHKLVKANAKFCKLYHHVNEAAIKSTSYAILYFLFPCFIPAMQIISFAS